MGEWPENNQKMIEQWAENNCACIGVDGEQPFLGAVKGPKSENASAREIGNNDNDSRHDNTKKDNKSNNEKHKVYLWISSRLPLNFLRFTFWFR